MRIIGHNRLRDRVDVQASVAVIVDHQQNPLVIAIDMGNDCVVTATRGDPEFSQLLSQLQIGTSFDTSKLRLKPIEDLRFKG